MHAFDVFKTAVVVMKTKDVLPPLKDERQVFAVALNSNIYH